MRKKIILFCTILLILLQIAPAVSAETIVDLDKKSSITVKAVYNEVALEGMKLNCIQVGKLVPVDGIYHYECIYNNSIIYTDENIHHKDNPKTMLELVKNSSKVGISRAVDKNGKIKFEDLKPGLYLIYQTKAFSKGGNKFTIAPFLVSIPYDGKYDVDIKSKPSLDLFPEDPSEPTKPNDPNLPQTGQLRWPIPVMASIGLICFILGWRLCFGKRRDSYE